MNRPVRSIVGVLVTTIVFATFAIGPPTCEAQFRPAPKIRDSSKRILDSPEFRHLRTRVREIEIPDRMPGADGDGGDRGDGQGDGGNGRDADDEAAEARARARARERERERRDFGGRGRPDRRNEEQRFTRGESSDDGGGMSFGGGGGALGAFLSGLAWVLVAAVCGLLLYFVLRGLMERDGLAADSSEAAPSGALEGEVERVTAPGDQESDVYVGKARELAASGRFREAIAQLLLGAMSFVEKEGLLRFRRGLTFRNYATALSRSKTSQQSFRSMVRIYEPLEYGRREQSREQYEAALAAYEDGFRAPLVRRTPRSGDV